ncbi:MAG: VWA domain-containing protein [Proteobacteria bacterium]|nr:VWA domain-containing protein [Pseudomonadota bacterium]
MTFLNVILLGGMAAAAIPVLLHFFNRSRPRVVQWGAMHLLDAAFQAHTRRLKFERWLLLLVRCLIPVLLALCMARPVLTGMRALLGGAKTSLVILLDDSYSMSAGAGATSNFAQAKEAAGKLIEQAGSGSDVAVVLMGGTPRQLLEAPTLDTVRVTKALTKLEANFGAANFPEALELAANVAAQMQHGLKECIVISDFQKVSFSEGEAAARGRALQAMKRLPVPPRLTFFHVGVEARDNVAVESLDLPKLALGVNQPLQVRATVRNFGERAWPDLRVYFQADGRERGAQQIALAAGEQRQVLFTHTFDTAGFHTLEVTADADALKADNSLAAVVGVWDKLPALLVNGDPSNEPLKGETDYLDLALSPAMKSAGGSDLILTRVVLPGELTPEVIARARVVVLANVRQLTDTQVRALAEFVANGGGLLVFPGNRINTDWYQRTLRAAGLLPLPFNTLAGGLEDGKPRAKIVVQPFTHPALELFNDARNGNLADAEMKLWFQLGTRQEQNDAGLSILAQLSTADPFLVEKKNGEGRIIQCAVPCDADWGNLPVRPVFVPLMQRLVVYLASQAQPPRNVEVGRPLAAFVSRAHVGRKAHFTVPDGERHEIEITGRGALGYVEFVKTTRPGTYTLAGPDGGATPFVVSAPRGESDLRQLTEPERKALAESLNGTLLGSVADYQQMDKDRRFGREAWKPLLWAVLFLCFSELVLVQWFTRQKGGKP